jgi:hypothetical protein
MAATGAERSIARLPEVATVEIVAQYERAARLLRSMIANAVRRGALGTANEQRKQLAAVNRLLLQLRASMNGLATLSIAGGYQIGAQSADVSMLEALPPDVAEKLIEPRFANGANKAAMQALQAATEQRLQESVRTVGRSVDDVFRRVGLEEVKLGTAAGLTRRETSNRIVSKLVDEGLTSFVDRAGRRWKLDVYAGMVARTTQREAVTLGVVDRMLQIGLDLVTVSKHAGSCDICKDYEGKTYSLTGHTEGFEVMTVFPPFHPNCRHMIGAAKANLTEVLELDEMAIAA